MCSYFSPISALSCSMALSLRRHQMADDRTTRLKWRTIQIYMLYMNNDCAAAATTHLIRLFVQTMYSTSSVYGFWKLKLLVRSHTQSWLLAWNRYITDITWPFNLSTATNTIHDTTLSRKNTNFTQIKKVNELYIIST